jgi:hypothetical protein
MPQGLQTLIALLILLPGFVSARIVRALSTQSQQSELERITEALIFSFINYVLYIACFDDKLPIQWTPTFEVSRWRVIFLLLMACVLGMLWGVIRSKDLALRLLRAWGLTERTSRESIWNDVFSTISGSAQVGLKDGRNVVGWISRYSDAGEERSIFLESASWVDENGLTIAIDGKGILLTDKSEIEYIMFLNDQPDRSSALK